MSPTKDSEVLVLKKLCLWIFNSRNLYCKLTFEKVHNFWTILIKKKVCTANFSISTDLEIKTRYQSIMKS